MPHVGKEIVYSPNKYRETEGSKVKHYPFSMTAKILSTKSGLILPLKCTPKAIVSSRTHPILLIRWHPVAAERLGHLASNCFVNPIELLETLSETISSQGSN